MKGRRRRRWKTGTPRVGKRERGRKRRIEVPWVLVFTLDAVGAFMKGAFFPGKSCFWVACEKVARERVSS